MKKERSKELFSPESCSPVLSGGIRDFTVHGTEPVPLQIPGLGLNVAKQIVAAREEREFISKQDLKERGKVSQSLVDFMTENHVLDGLSDENQLSLFDMLG